MEVGLYVALSGQLALQRRLDTIANNVANSSTTGFRTENVTFESILSGARSGNVAYAGRGDSTFSFNSGPVQQTGNPLDVALEGDVYLAVDTPNGSALTRDGRLRISSAGDLETLSGRPILDEGGAPIQVSPTGDAIVISRDGTITQGASTVGRIGLFKLPPGARVIRGEGTSLVPESAAEPVTASAGHGLVQGYLEGSNANPVMEMTRLIAVQRSFEQIAATIDQSDRRVSEAIKALGSGR